MKVELLGFEGCPHLPEAAARLQRVLDRLAPEVAFERVEVTDPATAEKTRFLGSPSIRVDGRDIEGRDADAPVMACRTYGDDGGTPPVWMIEAAVLRALGPRHLLFMCVANSARSQLAEGLARSLAPAGVRVSSAGSEPTRIRPEAVEALAEVGLDAAGQHSKTADAVPEADTVDTVITLCAEEVCPTWLGDARRVHWGLPDPAGVTEPEARREAFRAVRDELTRRLGLLLAGDAPA